MAAVGPSCQGRGSGGSLSPQHDLPVVGLGTFKFLGSLSQKWLAHRDFHRDSDLSPHPSFLRIPTTRRLKLTGSRVSAPAATTSQSPPGKQAGAVL